MTIDDGSNVGTAFLGMQKYQWECAWQRHPTKSSCRGMIVSTLAGILQVWEVWEEPPLTDVRKDQQQGLGGTPSPPLTEPWVTKSQTVISQIGQVARATLKVH